jgi:hypothetical protein
MMYHKGVIGECGRRGGYLEITNIPVEVKEQLCVARPPRCFLAMFSRCLLMPSSFQLQACFHRLVLQHQRPNHDRPHGRAP